MGEEFTTMVLAMKTGPLNILQTCFSHSWGGLEMQALEQSRSLSKRGHTVWLACCPGSRLQHEAANEEIFTLPLDVSGYFHPGLVWRLSRFIVGRQVDIVHCQLSRDLATVAPALQLARRNAPLLLSKRVGSYVTKRDPLHRLTYGRVDRVLAISEVIHRNVLATTPVPADRVLTLHDAIDTTQFAPDRVNRMKVRSEYRLAPDTPVIGFVGRFSPGKGHEELLQAAAIVIRELPAARFLIVGEASRGEQQYAQRIRSLSRALGLDPAVIFAGFRKDIPEVMASFDIFAFPSHAESFGLVLIEAMAMERPVVSTNCDGVLDIVVNGETGLFVEPRDSRGLAEALLRLLRSADLRERMGKAGRQRVEQLFDQQRQVETLEGLYRDLLRGRT